MLPSRERSISSATHRWTLSEGWNATTASGVVPAAIKSMISSYDLVAPVISLSSIPRNATGCGQSEKYAGVKTRETIPAPLHAGVEFGGAAPARSARHG